MIDKNCTELLLLDLRNFAEYTNYSYAPYPGDLSIWKLPDSVLSVKLFAYIVIMTGGLFGNISVILTIALNRSMRTTINFYIANLAVADTIICTFCMPPQFFQMLVTNYIFGAFMCKFFNFVQVACLTSSVFTLSAISGDRFMAVMFPFYVRITKQRPYVLITIAWIVSFSVAVPMYIVKTFGVIEYKDFKLNACFEVWPNQPYYDETLQKCITYRPLMMIYYTVISITLFFLPILIMTVAYSFVLWRLWMSKVPGEQHAANVNARSKAKKQVIKMVFVVLVAFVICWVPLQVTILYLNIRNKNSKLPKWFYDFHWFSYYIAYANSFLNPIVYGGFNNTFRQVLRNMFRCVYPREKYGNSARPKIFAVRRKWSPSSSDSRETLETQSSVFESSSQKSSSTGVELKHSVTDLYRSSNMI